MNIQSPFVLAALVACIGTAYAQSSTVTIFGVMDGAIRVSDGQGATGHDKLTTVLSGGLAPSRWGIRIAEDLGGGTRALAMLDSRFQIDTGTLDSGLMWQQSWVGLENSSLGRVTVGRDYNVLFDVAATTFSPFLPVGPFINGYKPEIAMALGVRNDNQVKYRVAAGAFSASLQVSAGEGAAFSPTTGKSYGGNVRYSAGPIGIGAGYLERRDASDRKAKAYLLGAAYRAGDLFLNLAWAQNRFDDGLNAALMLVGSGAENTVVGSVASQSSTRVNKRDMITVGGTYGFGGVWTAGAQYWKLKQTFFTPGAPEGAGDFYAGLLDYRFSRRTDLYAAIEYTSLDRLQLTNTVTGAPNGATSRKALMLGVRHNF